MNYLILTDSPLENFFTGIVIIGITLNMIFAIFLKNDNSDKGYFREKLKKIIYRVNSLNSEIPPSYHVCDFSSKILGIKPSHDRFLRIFIQFFIQIWR